MALLLWTNLLQNNWLFSSLFLFFTFYDLKLLLAKYYYLIKFIDYYLLIKLPAEIFAIKTNYQETLNVIRVRIETRSFRLMVLKHSWAESSLQMLQLLWPMHPKLCTTICTNFRSLTWFKSQIPGKFRVDIQRETNVCSLFEPDTEKIGSINNSSSGISLLVTPP